MNLQTTFENDNVINRASNEVNIHKENVKILDFYTTLMLANARIHLSIIRNMHTKDFNITAIINNFDNLVQAKVHMNVNPK